MGRFKYCLKCHCSSDCCLLNEYNCSMVILHLEEQKTLDGFNDCLIDECNQSLGYSDLCDSQFNRKSSHYQNVICFPCQLYKNEDGSSGFKTWSIENSYRCIIN